jgi:hypothetical protein
MSTDESEYVAAHVQEALARDPRVNEPELGVTVVKGRHNPGAESFGRLRRLRLDDGETLDRDALADADSAYVHRSMYATQLEPFVARFGDDRVEVVSREELKEATLVLGSGWLEGMTVNTIEPSPLNEASRDGNLALDLRSQRFLQRVWRNLVDEQTGEETDAYRDGDDLRADVAEVLDSTEVYDDTGIRLRWIVGTVVVLGGAAASREDLDAVVAEILDLDGVADVDTTDVDVR